MINYKQGKENVEADALSRRFVLVNTLVSRMMLFEILKGFYSMDFYFKDTFDNLTEGTLVDMWLMVFYSKMVEHVYPSAHGESYLSRGLIVVV